MRKLVISARTIGLNNYLVECFVAARLLLVPKLYGLSRTVRDKRMVT
jgi:hypothetical protein